MPISLTAADLTLELAPEIGGAVLGLRKGDIALMRPTGPEAVSKGLVRQTAGYPLIPYSNRIANGRFGFGGQSFQLTRNFGDHPHTIHGNGWQREWTIEAEEPSRAVLGLSHVPFGFGPGGWDGWPYRYAATQTFQLQPDSLTLTLTVRNTDNVSWPAGLGWHPFFPAYSGTQLQFHAEGVWINGEDFLPRSLDPVPPGWDYTEPRPLGEPGLDNVFAGWPGTARFTFPEQGLGLTLSADPVFADAVVYVPKGRGFFAIEPVTHMTDAINRMDSQPTGLVVLEPGASLSGTITLTISSL